jgi:hypothetical protein
VRLLQHTATKKQEESDGSNPAITFFVVPQQKNKQKVTSSLR